MSLLDCIGKKILECEDLLERHSLYIKDAKVKNYSDGVVYYCFFPRGVAISLQMGVVDAIELYQEDSEYGKVASESIPFPLESDSTGKDLVEKFGEPIEKGGGTKAQPIDIWLRWANFEITIKSRDWNEAQKIPWSTASIWEKFE